jgi:outer membrane lipoprotein-sorting protein
MKTVFSMLILACFGLVVSAQQSDKAKQILDDVSKKTQSYSSISADFSYTMENKTESINESYTGSVVLKGQKYNVHINKMGVRIISDGKTVWSYMEDANEVTISSVEKGSSDLMDPSKIFTIYEHGYKFNFIAEKTENGKALYYIDLIPEAADNDFGKISISVDKATMMIHSAIMSDKSVTQYRIKVEKMELNKPVDESLFNFDTKKYKDIEVIDLR